MQKPEENSHIIVDRRPLWIVILDRMRRPILLTLIFAVFLILLNQEGPKDLSPEGYKVLCVFFLCVSLWSTNLIPLSITSLLAIALIPLLGILEASQVYSFFGNRAVFFILGVFILSAAMVGSGLSVRLSMWVMEHFGSTPKKLITSIYFFGAISSCFMSEHAVATMLFPILTEIVNSLNLQRGNSVFAKALFFAMAWGCIIGGAMTVLGGGRVPLAVEILEKSTQGTSTIGILEYTQLSFPLVLLLFVCGWVVLVTMFPPDLEDIKPAQEILAKKHQTLGAMTFQEKGIAVVMGATLFTWFGYGDALGIANIAILSLVLLFSLNLINWKMVEPHINWAIILMYGGAICLGEVMATSGAALWLSQSLFEGTVQSGFLFLFSIAVLSLFFTTIMSNSAVIAILLPPAISMCEAYGISPALATLTVILPSNFAFSLPIATPASALAYSSRYITLGEMVRAGTLLSVLGMGCYLFLLFVYWPMIGFK
jgi:solute carrier family 13 (sodium-dependent dicarboxylate transporter), member 2/3/5